MLAAGVDVIDFGKGDPNEPTDPMIRQALVDALPERAPYPLAQGLPELRALSRAGSSAASASRVDPDTRDRPDVRLEGGDLLPRAGARRRRAGRRVRRAGVSGLRARRDVRGRVGADAAAAAGERLPPRSRRARRRRVALVWVNYPHNPTGAVAPLEFYEELAEAARAARLRASRRTRRTRSSGSTSRRRRRCRSPIARASSRSTR